MHALEEEFFAAFRAWNGERLAAAARKMIEVVAERALETSEIEELTWDLREYLESILGHPNLSTFVSCADVTLSLEAQGRWVDGQATAIGVRLAPPFRASEALKARWAGAGFGSEMVHVPRSEIAAPYPLKGEPDFGKIRRSTIHAPPSIELPSERTWAAGRKLAGGSGPWLTRYREGERRAVWEEMLELGAAVREKDVFGDAVDVALETMRRVGKGIEMLERRLRDAGFAFAAPEDAFEPAPADPDALIAALEQRVGLLPLSLSAFYCATGGVDFRGAHPEWESPGEAILDPLVVYPASYILAYSEDNWSRHVYQLSIAPDRYHKEEISGGPPYTIFVPSASADCVVEYEASSPTFVELLRRSLKFGGFPGWSRVEPEQRPAKLGPLTEGIPLP